MENLKKVYRIINEEGILHSNLPGNNPGFTGFWSESIMDARELLLANNQCALEECGGYSWCRLISTSLDNVVLDDSLAKTKKSGHSDLYDSNEVFVKEVIDTSKIVDLTEKYRNDFFKKFSKRKEDIENVDTVEATVYEVCPKCGEVFFYELDIDHVEDSYDHFKFLERLHKEFFHEMKGVIVKDDKKVLELDIYIERGDKYTCCDGVPSPPVEFDGMILSHSVNFNAFSKSDIIENMEWVFNNQKNKNLQICSTFIGTTYGRVGLLVKGKHIAVINDAFYSERSLAGKRVWRKEVIGECITSLDQYSVDQLPEHVICDWEVVGVWVAYEYPDPRVFDFAKEKGLEVVRLFNTVSSKML